MKFPRAFTAICMAAAVAVTVAVAGCWRSSDTPTPPPSVEFDAGPNFTFASDGNEVYITAAEPASKSQVELPDDVPLVHAAKVTLAVRSPAGEFVEYTTNEPGVGVRQAFVEELGAGGWELTSEKNSNFTHELAATKAGRSLHILIDLPEAEGSGTHVTVSHVGEG